MGAPNPGLAMLLPLLMQKMAAANGGGAPGSPGGGMPPGGPGTGPGGSPSDDASSASYGRELSSQRQADPAALAMKIHGLKMQIGELLSATLASNPAVARHLGKTLPALDGAIKEATTAAATLQVASPINSSAAAGAPGMGGAGPGAIPGM